MATTTSNNLLKPAYVFCEARNRSIYPNCRWLLVLALTSLGYIFL